MLVAIIGFIIFIYSVILHEMAHGWAAERLGDPTARISGRLTLNPFPHIDPIMSIILPAMMILTRFPVIIGAAKPIPIDPYNLRSPKKDMGLVGLAGPVTNLILALIFALLGRIFFTSLPFSILQILANACLLNLVLAFFNLIPIPPLDGGRVAVALLPERAGRVLASLENISMYIILFLFLFPNRLFSLSSLIFNLASKTFGIIFPLPSI